MGVNKRKKLSRVSISVFFLMVVDFIYFLTVHSRYHLQRLVHNENSCRLVFLQIWHKCQQQAAPHNAFATSFQPQISILAHTNWRTRTSLVSDSTTGLASITTKHNDHDRIKYLIIFQAIDSEVTKSSVHFSMSSFKKILLILYPTCWIDFHYYNLDSPGDELIKFYMKRLSFVAWILNCLYQLTITLTLTPPPPPATLTPTLTLTPSLLSFSRFLGSSFVSLCALAVINSSSRILLCTIQFARSLFNVLVMFNKPFFDSVHRCKREMEGTVGNLISTYFRLWETGTSRRPRTEEKKLRLQTLTEEQSAKTLRDKIGSRNFHYTIIQN